MTEHHMAAAMRKRWADPEWKEAQRKRISAAIQVWHYARKPEHTPKHRKPKPKPEKPAPWKPGDPKPDFLRGSR